MDRFFTIDNYPQTFAIKQMSGIKLLALRSTLKFNNVDNAEKSIQTILECIEFTINNTAFNVKENDSYLPVGIENDPIALNAIMDKMIAYLSEVFTKSNA